MSSRRLMVMTLVLLLLGALPFLLAQPSAVASAGLSLGFSAPLAHPGMLALVIGLGVSAALLPRDALVLLPLSFTLMMMLGGVLLLDVAHTLPLRYFALGAVLGLGLLVAIARGRLTVLAMLVLASLGFHLGGYFMQQVPSIASPMYYLFGALVSLGMVLAISAAFGATLVNDHEALIAKLDDARLFAPLRWLWR